jgi:hypothetical protein
MWAKQVLIGLAVAGAGAAGARDAAACGVLGEGTVTSVTFAADTVTVRVKDHWHALSFDVPATGKGAFAQLTGQGGKGVNVAVTVDGAPAELASIRVGDRVRVSVGDRALFEVNRAAGAGHAAACSPRGR